MAYPAIGTVISGTLRTQDLIPALLEELSRLDPAAYSQYLLPPLGPVPSHAQTDKDAEWWEGEDARLLLEDLFNALNDCCPENLYFGSIEGDGSDFGFWLIEE